MKTVLFALALMSFGMFVRAEDAVATNVTVEKVAADKPTDAKPAEAKVAPKFIVILPEQLDGVWYWTFYTTEQQHIVQSAVERAFVDAGLDVIDVSVLKLKGEGNIESLLNPTEAADKAKQAGATYVIVGSATAVLGGTTKAYGVTVTRSSASLTAKIVRASDGKVIAVKEAEANEGGQAVRSAGQAALKTAGKELAEELVTAAKKIAGQN